MEAKAQKVAIDTAKIRMAIQAGVPLTITTYTLPHEMEEYMSAVLEAFLLMLDHRDCVDGLSYCLKELVNNAKKANTKRVYFEEKKLNIEDAADYQQGMKDFKQDTISGIQYYLEKQKEQGLYVKVYMRAFDDVVQIEVHNNVELTVFEYKRIHDKLSRSLMYNSVEEGFDQLLDDTEGAGLGLVIMILILRRAGLSEESYEVISENGITITRVTLPFSVLSKDDYKSVLRDFLPLIELIPDFADNITFLNKLSEVSKAVSSDVAMVANLLKQNCALKTEEEAPCSNILELLKNGGKQQIRSQLFLQSVSADNILPESEQNRKLWAHSARVAFYAVNIATNICGKKADEDFLDKLYLGAILHDIAKIIFDTPHPSLFSKLDEFCSQKKLNTKTVCKLFAGFWHTEVGAFIAEKWNFPPEVKAIISFHHEPEKAPEAYCEMVQIVQFADFIVHYIEHDLFYEQFPQEVLDRYNITDEIELVEICNTLEGYAPEVGRAAIAV